MNLSETTPFRIAATSPAWYDRIKSYAAFVYGKGGFPMSLSALLLLFLCIAVIGAVAAALFR